MKSDVRSYSHLLQLHTFEERFNYLRVNGKVGISTFGSDRFLNQDFYHSREWRKVRAFVVTRDLGCDLGIEDREIADRIHIHHMNPITLETINTSLSDALNPEYLICCSFETHQGIHYGFAPRISSEPTVRRPYDTCPWRQ